jgi:cyclopropane fatty-acyl-phospholipid synthase-like methyltransferase
MKKNYTKQDFITFWGENGYTETWDGHQYNWSSQIQKLILQQIGGEKNKDVLEIGCGSGYWTRFLCENAKKVNAIDILPKQPFNAENLSYFENGDMQFNCNAIKDNSIDFVFSFGVFCHFSKDACEQYLKDIMRVLKKGATAILMYSDDSGLKKFYNDDSFVASRIYGEFNDYADMMPVIKKYDNNATKILEFRDLLVLITKI